MDVCKQSFVDVRPIIQDLVCAYLGEEYNYPWIVGFSGGKDSTLVVHLIFEMLLSLPPRQRTKTIHIISNDTLVESPLVTKHIDIVLAQVNDAAQNFRLPISVTVTKPVPEQSFWSLLIGKGYPSPNLTMRWCTDRLKIKPTSDFIMKRVSEAGAAIIVLGVRSDESQTRKRSIEKFSNDGKYSQHSSLKGAFVYRPIVSMTTEEVWNYLWWNDPAWGGTHENLINLYKEADGGECPLVLGKEDAPSCGTNSSRFGCWVCTVVAKDKSLQAAVDSGKNQYSPLIEFRDWLLAIRNDPSMRQARRRNGKISFGSNGKHIPGPFTIKARKLMLEKLLKTQDLVNEQLISNDEINIIHSCWSQDMQRGTCES